MLRGFVGFFAVCGIFSAPAIACPDQKGKVIFEDTFADDSGGWKLVDRYAEIKNGSLTLHPNSMDGNSTIRNIQVQNYTFSASDGDYCTEFILPKKLDPDAVIAVSLIFFGVDSLNFFEWRVSTDKTTSLYRLAANQWSYVFIEKNPPKPVNLDPGAVNTLRVVIKDGKLLLMLNGAVVKVIRTQVPVGELHFGVHAELSGKESDADMAVDIKSFKVTAGQ